MRSLALALALSLLASSAVASDGVLEINQTCAVQTRCFPGDAAGFPVTITTGGSYRLTGNLVNLSANTNTIEMRASLTTLDLGGFTITGSATNCTWNANTGAFCSSFGSGKGIEGSINCPFGNTVKNGVLLNSASSGVELCAASNVENVQVLGAFGDGIRISESGIVKNCTVVLAYVSGIWAPGGLVVDSTIRDSGSSANAGFAYGVNGGSELAATRGLVLQRILGNNYFRNARSLGTSLCDGVSC